MDYKNPKVKVAGELVQSFMSVSKILTKYTALNAESLGLTILQMGILNTINSHPCITLKEITNKLSISKSTVSVNVDTLVNLKLIERKTNEENRREINLTILPKGKELSIKSSHNAFSYKAMLSALEAFSEDEISFLIKTHSKLLKQLNDEESKINDI